MTPTKSDEERARQYIPSWVFEHYPEEADEMNAAFCDVITAIRAEATLAEQERCAKRLEMESSRHEEALEDIDADTDAVEYAMHLVAATDFRLIAAAIRKGT
jgi:hypothetical protein